jgi:hypothetical protein
MHDGVYVLAEGCAAAQCMLHATEQAGREFRGWLAAQEGRPGGEGTGYLTAGHQFPPGGDGPCGRCGLAIEGGGPAERGRRSTAPGRSTAGR